MRFSVGGWLFGVLASLQIIDIEHSVASTMRRGAVLRANGKILILAPHVNETFTFIPSLFSLPHDHKYSSIHTVHSLHMRLFFSSHWVVN